MQTRHSDKELYFREQVFTTREFVIPFIERKLKINESTRVLEVGCGESGNLLSFLERGCHVAGVDLSEGKIELAGKFLPEYISTGKAVFMADDIYNLNPAETGKFDIIMLRDVIEHIHDQEKFMNFIRNFLSPDGVIFFGFPPWYNPFGGHQQICKNRILSKLPYYHLLAKGLYKAVLQAGGEPEERIEALLEIKQTGISIERFEKILKRQSYTILLRKHFLFNPNYKIKFNIKPREQVGIVRIIPFFRNFLTTASYYLVKSEKSKPVGY